MANDNYGNFLVKHVQAFSSRVRSTHHHGAWNVPYTTEDMKAIRRKSFGGKGGLDDEGSEGFNGLYPQAL